MLFFPLPVSLDANGKDLNANGSFNILSIQSRVWGKITAPDAFGAQSSGYLEGEFGGTSDGDVNGFRLRHAFLTLKWETTELLVGQTWNPMFQPDCFAGVISFNTGFPFQPFGRNPQVRLKQSFGALNLYLTALTQRDFNSPGPNGFSSSYLRNAIVPELNAKIEYSTKSQNEDLLFGAASSYKSLVPRQKNSKNVEVTDEKVNSFEATGYFKYRTDPIEFKLQGFYGQNAADLMQIGGYAVKKTTDQAKITNDLWEYTPFNVVSGWTEIISLFPTSYGKFELAVFGGYSKNLGTSDEIMGDGLQSSYIFARNSNIDDLIRVSPRIAFSSGKTKFAFETEYTAAKYGINDKDGKVNNGESVSNIRFLLAAFIFF